MDNETIKNDRIAANEDTPDQPNMVEEAKAVRDDLNKIRDEIKAENDRKEKLRSEELLSGTAGGHIEAKLVSPEDKKVNDAKEFFSGTELGNAIEKANAKG